MCCEGLDMMLLNSDGAMAKRGLPGRTRPRRRPLTGRTVVVIWLGAVLRRDVRRQRRADLHRAVSTLHGEELENSYDASQVYNQQHRRRARAGRSSAGPPTSTTRQESGGERVVADFRDRDGAPIAGLEVRARFVHPFDRSADREALLAFRRRSLRRRRLARCTPAAGPW